MLTFEPISPLTTEAFKAVRLKALQDSPIAFGSTYASELQLTDADWLERSIRWTKEGSIGYLAMDSGTPCGIVASYLDEEIPHRAHVISMWVAPSHRRVGLGYRLIKTIEEWAKGCGVRELVLMVTDVNQPAITFYEQLGFVKSGITEPYPNDPAIVEYEMQKAIGG